ncbi:MAG: hypothetical protein U0521_08480 [Anaerolineae bacterium]
MANRVDSQMGVTLMVKGAILTGTLVGEREYLRRINDAFKRMARESMNKPSKEDLAAIDQAFGFEDLVEDDYPQVENSAEPPEASPIRHLHLRDPVIIYPGKPAS